MCADVPLFDFARDSAMDGLPENASLQNHSRPFRAKIEVEMALHQPIPALL
jgi:hypothetical protein